MFQQKYKRSKQRNINNSKEPNGNLKNKMSEIKKLYMYI